MMLITAISIMPIEFCLSEESVPPQVKETKATQHTHPVIQKVSETEYSIGKVSLHKDTREINFPAITHITDPETLIEYLITHTSGEKTHETLLTTEASPTNINIAFKLLSYPESKGLLAPNSKLDFASKFSIHVTYNEKTVPLSSWLKSRITRKPMPLTPWVYNGSYLSREKFMAEINGNIFSIITEPSSLGNYAGDDRHDDTLWFPARQIPKEGVNVTVTIKPWEN